jgi:hypothetical protein
MMELKISLYPDEFGFHHGLTSSVIAELLRRKLRGVLYLFGFAEGRFKSYYLSHKTKIEMRNASLFSFGIDYAI